jgi:membrane-bound metal-dependent hydrolase YbcI (DUF457 family)
MSILTDQDDASIATPTCLWLSYNMTDKTHQLIGLSATTAVFLTQHPQTSITWPIVATVLIGSAIGSVAPDIDQPTARIWDSIPLGGLVGHITARALGGHRNLSHSILGVILFSLLFIWLAGKIPDHWFLDPDLFVQATIIGFIAHLAADSVTVRGVPLLWPFGNDMGFPPYPFQGIRIITGKWFENLIVFPVVFLSILLQIAFHADRFCPIIFILCKRF